MKNPLYLLVYALIPLMLCSFKMKEQQADHFRTYYPSGAVKAEFPLKNGRLEGETTWYYESGAIGAVLSYRNNRLHGPARTFYEDGTLKREISHENNLPIGRARFYHPNGILSREEEYQPGKLVLRRHYDITGVMNYCEEFVREPGTYAFSEQPLDERSLVGTHAAPPAKRTQTNH